MPAANEPKKKYLCSRCKKTMSEIKFYTHRDGTKDDMCKECLCAHVNNFDPSTFTWILQRMDVPYVPQEWNVLRDRKYNEDPRKGTGGPAVMGKYLAKMKLKQFVNPDTNELYSWDETDLLLERRYTKEEKTEEELEIEKEQIERLNQALEAGEISEAEYKTLVPTDEVKEAYETNPDMFPGGTVVSGDPFAGDNDYISEDALPDPAADLTDEDKVYLAMKWGRLYKPNEWVELEKKYTEMINSFDVPTTISPDMKNGNAEYEIISFKYSDTIDELKNKYGLTEDNIFLSLFLFQLVKFSFSKDILIAYNKRLWDFILTQNYL
jgi:hypothetical protein